MATENTAGSPLWRFTVLLGAHEEALKDLNSKGALDTDDRQVGIDGLNSKGSLTEPSQDYGDPCYHKHCSDSNHD